MVYCSFRKRSTTVIAGTESKRYMLCQRTSPDHLQRSLHRAASAANSLYRSGTFAWTISRKAPSCGGGSSRTLPGAIDKARREGRLLCVSKDNVLAPYRMRERENHNALRRALKKHFGISLAFRDFTGSSKSSEGTMYSITPLQCVQVEGGNRLLVVTCAYTLDKREKRNRLSFSIAPDSIEFHLIESVPLATAQTRKRPS